MPLPAETERLWRFLKDQSALAGFTLIGGTALTLHLDHRISEDLDFIWVGDMLPRPELDGLRRLAAGARI